MNLEAMLGLKIFVERNSYLVLGGGGALPTNGATAADVRGMLGFIFEPSIGDRDGDGLRDDVDECPDEPEDFDGFADEDGCPIRTTIATAFSTWTTAARWSRRTATGTADDDGCPEGNAGDRDGDGILDNGRRVPGRARRTVTAIQDEDGCPRPRTTTRTACSTPTTSVRWTRRTSMTSKTRTAAPIRTTTPTASSIRTTPVPTSPRPTTAPRTRTAAPTRGSVIIEENSIVILEKIYFETDSAEIQQRSYPIIDAVAATLVGNPHISLVEVQGHADERSSDEYNIRLPRDRAAAVVEALVQRGVGRDRLRSGGYGERCPVDPRHNQEAWEANRRVEFKIIRTEDGPTGVEVACPAGRELIPR